MKVPRDPALARLEHLNNLLLSIRQAGRVLNQARDPIQLCQQVCESLIQTRGYAAVWIGRPDPVAGVVIPVAIAGAPAAAFPRARITWDDTPHGNGPVGIALREGRAVVFEDVANDPRFAPWRDDVVALGGASIGSFPLNFQGRLYGALTVKDQRARAFDQEEIRLLEEFSTDVAHAWNGLEEAAAHRRTRENLETLVEAIPEAVFFKDGEGRWQITNSSAKRLFQTHGRAWQGRTDLEMAMDLHELRAAHQACHDSDELAWASRRMATGEERLPGADGTARTFEVCKVPLFHEDGRRKGLVIVGRDVTESRQTQDALRVSEMMASCSRDIILRVRCGDGRIVDANPAAVAAYGYSREELLALRIFDLRPVEDQDLVLRQLKEARPSILFEATHRRKNGKTFPVEVSSQLVTIEGVGMRVSVIRDITTRKSTEARLRLLQTAVETAANGIVMTDIAGTVIWANEAFKAMSGCSEAELIGQDLGLLRAGQHPATFYAQMRRGLQRGEQWSSELVHRRKDGDLRHIRVTVSPVETAPGEITHLIAIQEDITDKKRAEQELREANARLAEINVELEQRVTQRTRELTEAKERFEKIFDCSPVGVAISGWDDGVFLNVNQAFADVFGFSREEMLHRSVVELNLRDDDRQGALFLDTLKRARHLRHFQCRRRKKSGEPIDLEISAEVIEMDGARCVLANVIDITDRVRAEHALERSAREIEDLYNRAPCGYHSLDRDGTILQMNDTELTWLGYTREEVIGHKVREFLSARGKRTFDNNFPEFKRQHRILNLDLEFRRKDGTHLPTVINCIGVLDDQGGFIRSRTTVFDNTQRLKADRELRKALTSAAAANRAKTEFLANMSHEIRTPMNAIMGYAQILQRDSTLPVSVRSQVEIINRNSQALLSLLNSILELSKIETGHASAKADVFRPTGLFNDLVGLFRERAQAKHLTLTFSPAADLPEFIEADQGKVRQAVANLLSNAIKFTGQGGVQLNVSSRASPTSQLLVVEVTDTGPGIADEELAQLFQQFGQTSSGRSSMAGTGLGLYLSREYARLMGGELTVQSQRGAGSIFRLEVPVKVAMPPAAVMGHDDMPVLRQAAGEPACRILIADDLADNRDVLRLVLERVGFQVQIAANGWEVLRTCKASPPRLILMDAWMPEMDGYETIRRLRGMAVGAQPKILMISASAFEADRQAALAVGADEFVAKPFRDIELLEKIRQQLGCEYEVRPTLLPVARPPVGEPAPATALSLDAVRRLPPEVCQGLRAALAIGDFETVFATLEEVNKRDPAVGLGLMSLASQYNAEELLRLLAD